MNSFQPFDLERIMSVWEHRVEYNLTESGVHPVPLGELLADPAMLEDVLSTELNYPECNGTIELRENIAALYPGAGPDNVLVTVGCAEANFVSTQTILGPGDEAVVMLPNYQQIWGLVHNFGGTRKAFHLRESNGWSPDLDELRDTVTENTKMIAVCNPNNPTGYILTPMEMEAIVAVADKVGAWILADETYAGAERLVDTKTPTFWGMYDKVLATASLSKAYGLPGLRVGWVIAPADTKEEIWRRHEYTTISAGMLSNKLATLALSPQVRPRLVQRARDYIRRGYPTLENWLKAHPGTFSLVPPQAAAIAFIRYHLDINSTELVERLIREKSVFIVPGDTFGMDNYVRISFALSKDYVQPALDRVHDLIVELQ